MCAEKQKENFLQMTRLIRDMETKLTFSNAMKTITLTLIDVIAKVTHKEQSGRKLTVRKQ